MDLEASSVNKRIRDVDISQLLCDEGRYVVPINTIIGRASPKLSWSALFKVQYITRDRVFWKIKPDGALHL